MNDQIRGTTMRLGAALAATLVLAACSSGGRAETPKVVLGTKDAPPVLSTVTVLPPDAVVEAPGIGEAPVATVDDAPAPASATPRVVVAAPDVAPPRAVAPASPRIAERREAETEDVAVVARPAPAPRAVVAPRPVAIVESKPTTVRDPDRIAVRAEAVPRDPGQARSLNREAIVLINAGRPGQAIPLLERALALQPRDPEMLGNLGYAYMLTGEHGKASAHLRRSLDASPTRSATWLNLGQTYAEQGQQERAVEAVLTGYAHSSRKDSVRSALRNAATGRRFSDAWREAAGMALARIGDG